MSKSTRTRELGAPNKSDGTIKRVPVRPGENQKLSQRAAIVFLRSIYGEDLPIIVENIEFITFYIEEVRYEWHREGESGDAAFAAKFYYTSVIHSDVTKATRLKIPAGELEWPADPSTNMLLGDQLWVIGYVGARRVSGPCTVSKIGRKYLWVKAEGFNLDNARFLVESLESQTKGLTLYREETHYRDQQELWMLKDKMRSTFASIGGKVLTLEQYREIDKIIDTTGQ